MSILKLKPAFKDNLWGGHRLVEEFNFDYDGEICAEAWVLSCHPDGPSIIAEGEYAGKTLKEYIDAEGFEVLGTNCRRFRDFPILVKFIDARDDLSIQVHPSNGYALRNEGQYGKTEMWYVLDAEPGAFLYQGFKKAISKEEYRERIENNTLLEVLNKVEVHKGDIVFIESGTLHAIGKGIMVAEIQQNSNVTYRIYDYNRKDKNGKTRELHIDKALAVTNRVPPVKENTGFPHIADCDYFTVDRVNLDGISRYRMQGTVTEKSFLSLLILDGEGTISSQGEKKSFRKGDSLLITAGSGDYQIEGKCDALMTTIREKASPMRVGVIIGSYETRVGLVDEKDNILSEEKFMTRPERGYKAILEEVGEEVLSILENHGVPLEQCVGVGIGVPGTIDRKKGIVNYSNNIKWENVNIVEELGRVIPCPVRIANNADCAALGEAIEGAGKDYSDVVMFTLGNGVGGGIILNGKVFEGGMIGGSELGHMVVKADGLQCSCGRKGCLEAYASIPALLSQAKEATGLELSVNEIFDRYDKGDRIITEVLNNYMDILGTGVVNVVNIFRPQLVLLGGSLSHHEAVMLDTIRDKMARECFGSPYIAIPQIAIAQLGSDAGIIGAANL
ncbi:MAG: ROK family protein [Erysipelotrichaceae bacterium]|nr:ROK family protein [Erysipelotrichaceae bacterium]